MRASLNGANVLVIIGSDIKTPNGLAVDHRAEKLYFSDATLDKIERCEYDGSNRYVSPRSSTPNDLKNLTSSIIVLVHRGVCVCNSVCNSVCVCVLVL